MNYEELAAQINQAIAKAAPFRRRQFAESALAALLNSPELEEIDSSGELNEAGLAAFHEARAKFRTATSETVLVWVESIDSGSLCEGNMQPELLWALIALEGWSKFLAGNVSGVESIAEQLIDAADYIEPMPPDDALASAEVAAVYERIISALNSAV